MGPTTGRIQRNPLREAPADRVNTKVIQPAPPSEPENPPRPAGDLSRASLAKVADAVVAAWDDEGLERRRLRRLSTVTILEHLQRFPGTTWQQRWVAAGLDEYGTNPGDLGGEDKKLRKLFISGTRQLFCLRVIRPSLDAFRGHTYPNYALDFRLVARDPLLDKFHTAVEASDATPAARRTALFDVACALTVFGISLGDLTPEVLLHYSLESRRKQLTRGATKRGQEYNYAAIAAWHILYESGHFPPSAPHVLRAALVGGQKSVEELVDRQQLRNTNVRNLLVDYLRRRAADLDHSSLRQLARVLPGTFWSNVEKVNPDQADLRLSEETYQQWKETISVLPGGRPRLDMDGVLLKVRTFYLDLQSWAVAEPERWAAWSVPCPVRDAELRWFNVRRREIHARMAERTRVRQPLLPLLVDHVTNRWMRLREILTAAQAVEPGERFTAAGAQWQRTASEYDLKRAKTEKSFPVRAVNRDSGELVAVTRDETAAFWDWAVIEVLRHAGLPIEELTELTHLSVRNYQRPNGEVVALLVVTPSKTDRERVIPMSAELFHVIAQVIRRHRGSYGTVPIATRYDVHEKVWCPPLPYLFQTQTGLERQAMSTSTIWRRLRKCCTELAKTHPEFVGTTFSAHDFRRIFATDLVNSGLPIHIGAALLGHLNIQTTRGYVAVFDDDIVRHYQQFLDQRRQLRPQEEYRDPTSEEWSEFQEHFDKRKVELGSCGRPYGTPCAHEHACIRCPMLSVNPTMLPRLDELEDDLVARRQHAISQGWKGEVEGIELTLTFLRSKRAQVHRSTQLPPVNLGIPSVPHSRLTTE
ncbi:site-specific integrase [Streptomyces sp. NPDC046374]|uniref:tyrosine-type recombinase/integrase n=1 Tax=Streptomyces sp. NPDC046374 TaxID=3154917 RepID=UPI0033C1794E